MKNETYIIGKKKHSLVIFLHGYNGNIADHQYAIDWLRNKLDNSCFVIPEAPEICDRNPEKRQWFGMLQYDPEKRRLDEKTSNKEIFQIYNLAKEQIDENCIAINDFITEQQKKYNISDKNTYLIGFSQGAMLTIYTALTRKKTLAGAFAISGLIAGESLLGQKIKSYPPLFLFHGRDDMKVQYKTLTLSKTWLTRHNIPYQAYTYPELAHKISEPEIDIIADYINKH